MPLIQGTATQARRFACDRCHGQKLRCPRPADGSDLSEPCVRCRKAGKNCNVSATLKTGRPSKALRLQARLEACPSIASPRPEQSQGLKKSSASPQKENGNVPDESGREGTVELFQFAASNHTSQSLSPSISASTIPTPTGFETTSTAMMDDNFELLDFDMDFLDTMDANMTEQCLTTAEEIPGWNYMAEPDISITRSNSADQLRFPHQSSTVQSDCLLELPFPDSPAYQNFTLDNNIMTESSTCSSPFSPQTTLGDRKSTYNVNQDTRKPDVAIQDFSQGAQNVTMTTEDVRLAFPSPCPTLLHQKNPRHSEGCNRPATGSFTTPGLRHGHSDKSQNHEFKHSQTILQLQIEIYDCSGRIIYPRSLGRASESDDQQRQSRSGSLGTLFCTAEKFIELIDQFCSCPRACSPPSTPSSLALFSTMKPNSTAVADAERKSYSDPSKLGVSSPALGPFGQEIPDTVPPSEPRFPDAATFHLIMACYTRLLTAYDVIIETIAAQLPTPSNFGGCPCSPNGASFSIGDFTVHSGTFLESLLHLQVISHQLGRLGDALYRYVLLSQPPRQAENFSTASLRRPYQGRRTGAPATMGDSAMEIVEEQETALKMKIAKIRPSARESHMF